MSTTAKERHAPPRSHTVTSLVQRLERQHRMHQFRLCPPREELRAGREEPVFGVSLRVVARVITRRHVE